jgi:hypothetical protein
MNPRDFDKTFIGRGPIQVTFGWGYIQTLVYLDTARSAASGGDADALGATLDAIKTKPTAAADPQHTFIFSAAYMHMSGMVRRSRWGFTTAGMSGVAADPRIGIKQTAYNTVLGILQDAAKQYAIATEN